VPPHDGFTELFAGTTLDVELERDFLTAAWRKLLSNLAGNPITALTMGRAEIVQQPAQRALAEALIREGAEVGRAAGAQLADDEPERVLAFIDALPPQTGSSMLFDRLAGRPLEHGLLTGAVVRAADRHGIDVPRAILPLLQGLDDSSLAPVGVRRATGSASCLHRGARIRIGST
jgi:2-dehydropantoate 2-reductase